MNPRFTGTCMGIIVVAMFITGALVYPHLPVLTSYWNPAKHVTGAVPRLWGIFGLPVITLGIWGLWALLPKIDPIAKGFPGFRYVYDFFWVLLISVLAYIYALALGTDLGLRINMGEALLPAVALLIIVTGALLPHIKRNWFFGVRTPWTLSSDAVWQKTHSFASPLFMLAGLFPFFALINPTRAVVLWAIFAPLLLAALISAVYSYFLYKRERASH